ncbi:MAG: type I restriction endonuclease [Ruminococcus sp.]|nr:type I restriction endonuclease [Ruminococcus sp.]
MDFIDELKQFSKRVDSLKDKLPTEEATKSSLIMPFFQMLGYDVFNPDEFMPEFTADVGIKKGEKVDYAILNNGEPVILIEAKWVKEDLKKHDSQLFRYFSTTKAKFAILTNGIIYRFYTDLDEANKMDSIPFMEINILDIRESQVNELKKFKKTTFSVDQIMDTASQLKYTNEFKAVFAKDLENPSDALVSYFLTDVYNGRKSTSVIEKFRPIVKDSLTQFISETMNEKLKTALGVSEVPDIKAISKQVKNDTPQEEEIPVKKSSKIITTEEELEAFFVLKNMLKEKIPFNRIGYKDSVNYMSIICDGKSTKWICRLYFNGSKKYITVPDNNEKRKEIRFEIENPYDILKYENEVMTSASRFFDK